MSEEKNIHRIKVPDMNCQHCKMRITDALKQIPGIRSIMVDLITREVEIKCEASLLRETIVERIRQEGYQPQ